MLRFVRNISAQLSHSVGEVLNSGVEEVAERAVVVLEETLDSSSLSSANLSLGARRHSRELLGGGTFHAGEEGIVGSNELGVTRTHIY
jgi:hypothetical protein